MVFFQSSFFICFFSNLLIQSDYMLQQKWCIEKDKTPEAVYLLKVTNNDTTGIIESCSK